MECRLSLGLLTDSSKLFIYKSFQLIIASVAAAATPATIVLLGICISVLETFFDLPDFWLIDLIDLNRIVEMNNPSTHSKPHQRHHQLWNDRNTFIALPNSTIYVKLYYLFHRATKCSQLNLSISIVLGTTVAVGIHNGTWPLRLTHSSLHITSPVFY